MNNLEIASFICQELLNIGVKTTLSGGFCVEIYRVTLHIGTESDISL